MTATNDYNVLERKAYEWALKVKDLYNTPVPPQLEREKALLITFAKKVKETIEKVTGPIEALQPITSLGILPAVVGVVGVAAAAAAITKWTYDYNTFTAKLRDRNALIAAGMTPEQAIKAVNATSPVSAKGWSDNLVSVAKIGGAGFALYLLAKKFRVI